MNKILALAFLVVGIIALCFAYNADHSAASSVSRAVTGTSTDKTIWLLVGGIFALIVGIAGLFMGSGKLLKS